MELCRVETKDEQKHNAFRDRACKELLFSPEPSAAMPKRDQQLRQQMTATHQGVWT